MASVVRLSVVVLALAFLQCRSPSEPTLQLNNQTSALNPTPTVNEFAVLASSSLEVNAQSRVIGGDVGAQAVTVKAQGGIDSTKTTHGRSVRLQAQARIGDVQTDTLEVSAGATHGAVSAFVPLPALPSIAPAAPGTTDVVVSSGASRVLAAGNYRALRVSARGKVELIGGVYHFASIALSAQAEVVAQAPTEIIVLGAVDVQANALLAPRTGLDPQALKLSGHAGGDAIAIGAKGVVRALVLAPNGAVRVSAQAQVAGAIFARDVSLAAQATVTFSGGFAVACVPASCDDGNPCTTDRCETSGCVHVSAAAGTSCSNGNACDGDETCSASGSCLTGAPPAIDDGNPCTDDSCLPATGVVHLPSVVGSACGDANACNGGEFCDGAGACGVGVPPIVDDGNPCTIDSCDAATGVHHDPAQQGTSCGNTNACAGAEVCDGASACVTVPPPPEATCARTITPDDPRIALARLDLAEGAAPLSQNFTIAVNPTIASGTRLSSNFGGVVTAGHAAAIEAASYAGDYVFPPTSECTRITIPFDRSRFDGSPTAVRASLTLHQVLSLSGTNVVLAEVAGPIAIDPAAGTLSACVTHLSNYVATMASTCTPAALDTSTAPSVTLTAPIEFVLPQQISSTGFTVVAFRFFDADANATVDCAYAALSGDATFVRCSPQRLLGETYRGRSFSLNIVVGITGAFARWSYVNETFTCSDLNLDCDQRLDNCGDVLNCGTCSSPATCGGDGVANVCGGTVPYPETTASALSETDNTSFADGVRFIWEGTPPIQRGVALNAIDLTRVSLLRGRVLHSNGAPFGGVKVSVAHHPELGETDTRGDGTYDIAFNGGGTVTLVFERTDHFPAERSLSTKWNAHSHVDDVVLIEPDRAKTTGSFGATAGDQLITSSFVGDFDGIRAASVFIRAGTVATVKHADGSTSPLLSGDIRLTEYTRGLRGGRAMPAQLPGNSGYTYCVEASIDGIPSTDRVAFSQPVSLYYENFLNTPVGAGVPSATYDRKTNTWDSGSDGYVLKLLSLSPIEIDGTGDDVADPVLLTEIGLDSAEAAKIAERFAPGQSFVRARLDHFSTVDTNYILVLEPTPLDVPSNPPAPPPINPDPTECNGSRIECQNQFLGERIPLQGVPTNLYYASDRTSGFVGAYRLDIPVGPIVNPEATVDIVVTVAGKRLFPLPRTQQSLLQTRTTVSALWDGRDLFGRKVQGSRRAKIDINYFPPFRYIPAEQLLLRATGGGAGGAAVGGDSWATWDGYANILPRTPARLVEGGEPKLNQGYEVDVGTWEIGADKLGHWQLGFHHHYDPQSHILYLGTGKRVQTSAIGPVVDNLWVMPSDNPVAAPPPELTAIMPDGSVYFAAQNDSKIAKMSRDGSVSVVAGTSAPSFADGTGSAARFDRIRGLATDDAGNLYIADAGNKRIRKMTPAFIVSTIAGGGADTTNHKPIEDEDAEGGFIGEPNGLGRRPFDGSLVFYETSSRRLWEIRGGKLHGMSLDEDVANNAEGKVDTVAFAIVRDIWAAPNGDIYLCELGATPLMRKLSPSGDVTTIAGGGLTPVPAEGIPGNQLLLTLDFCDAPRLASDGSIYFRAADDIIGRVLVDGTFRTAFGAGSHSGTVEPVQGGAAAQQKVLVNGSNVAPDGSIYVFTPVSVSRVTTLDRWSAGAANLVPSEDGREVYVFDDHGRHIDTKDALTNALIYHFEYDASGLLVRVRDRQNLQTSIQRDSNGVATSITGPYGDVTFLSIDAALDLLTVTSPASEVYTLNYANHLLKELRSPRNAVHRYDYNTDGRLIRDKNAGAGGWTLSRAENGPEGAYELTMSTDGGRTTRYSVSSNAVDATRTHDFVHADGTASQTTYKNGEVVTRDPDGLVTTIVDEPDPRFGMRAPTYSVTRKTPVGLERRESTARTTTLTSPLDLTSIDTWQEETSVNGVTASTKYTRATRTIDSASFVGRSQTLTLDAAGYPQTLSRPGITDVTTSFDANGRLQTITRDTRQTTFGYDAKGRLRTVTDPLLRTVTYGRDAAGRVISILRPDLRVIGIGRDAHGNVTSVTPPGRPVHQMSFSLNDVQESYTPPLASGTGTLVTGYRYNTDDQLIAIDRPDGLTVDIGRDLAGRARTVSDAFGTRTFNYFAGTGKLGSIAYPAGASLAFSYDGPLLLANEWTGDVAGNVTRIYDDRFFTDRLEVNGVGVDYTIDDDGFVTGVDDLSIVRDPSNALLATISLDQVTTTFAHSPFGERERERTEASGSPVYEESYMRDALGRIETRTIDDGTTPVIFAYHYDMAGRLDEVKKDGVVVETYGYDDNGNRAGGTYDNQDRLLAMGTTSYAYTAAGELRTKTTPGGTTTYSYDQLGNLRRVDLPGTRIDYVIDGLNRRVGKKVNGTLVQGFLYDGQLRIVAELDSANAVVSRFVYASRSNVPDFMIKGGVTYRIITDHVGSPMMIVDAADGSIAQRLKYDSFGDVLSDDAPGFQPFGFAGGLRDLDTGLVRFGARDYDPETGRWTAQDPIRFAGGGTNLYGYVISDPVNLRDPAGLSFEGDADLVNMALDLQNDPLIGDAVRVLANDPNFVVGFVDENWDTISPYDYGGSWRSLTDVGADIHVNEFATREMLHLVFSGPNDLSEVLAHELGHVWDLYVDRDDSEETARVWQRRYQADVCR